MSNTYTYEKVVYRIRRKQPEINQMGYLGVYEGNDKIGTFEFHTEKNARIFIEEQKLVDATVDKVTINTTEEIINL